MSEVLDRIDYNLTVIEDRLLKEFVKIQESGDPSGYGALGDALETQVEEALVKLRDLLDHSGSGRLELTTDYHEVLRARMFVLDRLLERKIPTVCMNLPERSVFTARDLTGAGMRSTRKITKRVVVPDREASNRSFLSFFKGRFGGQKTGQHNIKVDAVDATERREAYGEGPYAAAQELAELASTAVTYREIEESEGEEAARAYAEQQARGKALFDARDLSSQTAPAKDRIARSPEQIRRKLEARRRAAEKAGRASFTATDLSPIPDPSDKEKSEEEAKEKARFEARDLKTRE